MAGDAENLMCIIAILSNYADGSNTYINLKVTGVHKYDSLPFTGIPWSSE